MLGTRRRSSLALRGDAKKGQVDAFVDLPLFGFAGRRALAGGTSTASGGARALQDGVERGARTHHRLALLGVGLVVAADVHRLALHLGELGDDLLLVLGQGLGERGELARQLGVFGLSGQALGPERAR
jgi:X-X-X-Leu-X-X-Gly heptad repeat protein